MVKTAIVIPCYNEAARLRIDDFRTFLQQHAEVYLIFVNDGSTDDTLKVLSSFCESFPDQAYTISLPDNSGKAEAVRQGILRAFDMDVDYIGYWDADLSTPLKAIIQLVEKFNEDSITIVLGARVHLLGLNIKRRLIRHYLGRIFATFASMLLNFPVYDTQCGAKLFRASEELKTVFSKPFVVNWIFDVELLGRFKILKKVTSRLAIEKSAIEVPLEEWIHVKGSKVNWLDFPRAFYELAKLFIYFYFPIINKIYIRNLIQDGSSPANQPFPETENK